MAPANEAPPEAEAPAAPAEPAAAAEEAAPADPAAALAAYADAATRGRISPGDEDRATRLMRDFIKAGNLPPALDAMTKLPWILGVRAAEQSWPTLNEADRATLLDSIGALPGDNAARLRLSLSRSLSKIELPAGLHLAALTCRGLWNAERGALSAEHSKIIGNVFIGRGKPWVLQLPLEGLPAEEAAPIAACAVFSAFNVNNPPITQLSVLRYAAPLLGGLHENLLTLVARGVSRWSGKWQNSLRKEIPDLPAPIATALRQEKEASPANGEAAEASAAEEAEVPLPPELEEKLKIATDSGDAEMVATATQEINAWREAQRVANEEREHAPEDEGGREDTKRGRRQRGRDRDRERERPDKKERPAYVSREQAREHEGVKSSGGGGGGGGSFNLAHALRQIDAHVQQLRNELASAQAKLRKSDGGRRIDRVSLSVEEASLTPDELRRLILQLEARNAELQGRVEELLADSELRVQSMSAEPGAATPDLAAQLRSLLALKLQDDYADFIALERGSPDVIVRQHYRGLIRSVFAVLVAQGLPLVGDLPPPPPAPLPPPPPPPELEDEEEEDDDEDEEEIPSADERAEEDDDDEEPLPPDDEPVSEDAAGADDAPPPEEGEASEEDRPPDDRR
jgi:hypothetical protein